MTVEELIQELSNYPSKCEVVTDGGNLSRYDSVTGVESFRTGEVRTVVVILHKAD